jgi:hypothetical protein
MRLALCFALALLAGCAPEPPVPGTTGATSATPTTPDPPAASGLASAEIDAALARADEVEEALRPVSLLTPGQIGGLQRFRNAAQLRVARAQGVPQPVGSDARQRLIGEGRLVALRDTTFWVVREMDYSEPLVTPATRDLLVDIGRRFHERLADLGVPPLRFEITSALRTAESQQRLRQSNPNAAGESTHLYGTTVDITYASFRAPAEIDGVAAGSDAERLHRMALDLAGGRMALELKAELGRVLRALQDEGRVMVTYERRQPVFHMTAR